MKNECVTDYDVLLIYLHLLLVTLGIKNFIWMSVKKTFGVKHLYYGNSQWIARLCRKSVLVLQWECSQPTPTNVASAARPKDLLWASITATSRITLESMGQPVGLMLTPLSSVSYGKGLDTQNRLDMHYNPSTIRWVLLRVSLQYGTAGTPPSRRTTRIGSFKCKGAAVLLSFLQIAPHTSNGQAAHQISTVSCFQ